MMRPAVLLLALACVALVACQSVEGDLRMLAERPPEALDADPAASGLLVIEASLELSHGAKIPMVGAALLRQGTERVRYAGAEDDVAIFQALPPDLYEVLWLAAPWMRYETPSKYPLPKEQHGVVRIEAGVPSYLGFVRIVRHSKSDFEYLWDASPARERAAWQALLERYPTTRWREAIEARLAQLAP